MFFLDAVFFLGKCFMIVYPLLFLLMLIFFGRMVVALIRRHDDFHKKRAISYFLGLFVLTVLLGFSWRLFVSYAFDSSLEDIATKEHHVYFDEVLLDQRFSKDLINRIINRQRVKISGSHPTGSSFIKFEGAFQEVGITLRKDSRDKNVYWLFLADVPYGGSLGYVEVPHEIVQFSVLRASKL
jgi:hypothetical protein